MYFQRIFFVLSFLLCSFFLWKAWEKDKNMFSQYNLMKENSLINISKKVQLNNLKDNDVTVKTDVLNIVIDKYHGCIKSAKLLKYRNEENSSQFLDLLKTNTNYIFQMKTGFTEVNDLCKSYHNIDGNYYTKKKFYQLLPLHNKLVIPMTFITKNGIKFVKKFIFNRGRYDVQIKYYVYNNTNKDFKFRIFGECIQTINQFIQDNNNLNLNQYKGVSYSSDHDKYVRFQLNEISNNKETLYQRTHIGWIAMVQKYFASVWIPNFDLKSNIIYTKKINNNTIVAGYHNSSISLAPHSFEKFFSKLWIGPKNQNEMAALAPNLNFTIEYGFLWFLSQPLFHCLNVFHSILGNWGFSIIFLTIMMRLLMFPLTKSQFLSMAKLKSLKPDIDYLKNKYKNDPKRMSTEIILLYKKKKINPLSGLLPVIIQMPIFLSFYYTLTNSIELKYSPFIFWIKDLSSYDPFYVLPILMGLSMFIGQKINSSQTFNNDISENIQEKIMILTPFLFTIFFLWFPSGLVLYYLVSNIFNLIQQRLVNINLKK
ncbi:membrane protein insertase YidC [Buchnera aphidicola]|uniref:membrane protein insertase YidC n=1 Tax=Buchnera aphidicola TaxID=9 RepID=UPI002237E7AE|nr:membrane protein insertase YidC [Buchnera aphidicola]MCW5197408.1 membrane protein insertase YidC [Buchnera aphidicola (Chaitophorus viminalis)]